MAVCYTDYGNRGMGFESTIELSNMLYAKQEIALIYKTPTPINILGSKGGIVTGALRKSTIDFQGIVQIGNYGAPIAFDAKETRIKRLPFANIPEHQIEYLKDFHSLGGIAFFLVHFEEEKRMFRLSIPELIEYMNNPYESNKKSLPLSFFEEKAFEVKYKEGKPLDYLQGLSVEKDRA